MDNRHIEGLDTVGGELDSCVLTIGNFDGVHVGHQRILAAARAMAGAAGPGVVALTFDPPPNSVLRPDDIPHRIVTPKRKAELLLAAGARTVVTARTDRSLLAMPPEEFIRRIIVARFAPAHVVEGPNFFFGRRRRGDIDLLQSAGQEFAFGVHVVEPVEVELADGSRRVSSTLIRRLLSAGRVEDANRCLGREFTLYGYVTRGAGRGAQIGYPTVNLGRCDQLRPSDGVYAGWARVGRREFPAAVSVGARPTFGAGPPAVEAFLIGAEGRYYDRELSIRFLRRLREQVRFADGGELKAQIAKDVQRVREICER